MTGERILLDSVILIDHFNGVELATEYVRKSFSLASISVITRAEVLTGFNAASRPQAQALLDRFRLFPIDGPVADLAAHLRHEHRWKLPDAFQAAVALHNNLLFVTRNTKDFQTERYAFVRVPYEVTP